MALNVGRVKDCGVRCLRTKSTPGFFPVVNEVLTPDLNRCVTILGAVSGIESVNVGQFVVAKNCLIDAIGEVTGDGDFESDLFVGDDSRTVVALKATELLNGKQILLVKTTS